LPEIAAPLWLLALGLAPLIRWLHRFHTAGRPLVVPALFLWREAGMAQHAGARRGEPDPVWRRRAGIVALLVLALSGPGLSLSEAPRISVWIEDGPALFARESDGRDRLTHAAGALALALRVAGEAEVRALYRPGDVLRLQAGPAHDLELRLRQWLTGPGPGPLTVPTGADRQVPWLLAVGADPRVTEALHGTRFRRVIPLGEATENLALLRLALRPSLQGPGPPRGLAVLTNAGLRTVSRTLELRLDGKPFERAELTLAQGETMAHGFALAEGSAGAVEAVLLPVDGDALSLDDALAIDSAGMPGVTIAVAGACPADLVAMLAAHPGLRRVADGQAGLRVWCDAAAPPAGPPTIWFPPGPGPDAAPPSVGPVWSDALAMDGPPLAAAWLRPIARPPGTEGQTLLAAGDLPLIVEQDAPRHIAVLFALDGPGIATRPEGPVILDLLLARLAGRGLLLPPAGKGRDAQSARIAPGPLPAAVGGDDGAGSRRMDLTAWPLAAALLLLLLDLVRTAGAMMPR
jgi:hypothetical protein